MGNIFFYIGTEAELIKVFPIMLEFQSSGIDYYTIASGQNDISKSRVLQAVNGGKLDLLLSDEKKIKKSAIGLLHWYINTRTKSKTKFVGRFGLPDNNDIMIVHGDTVSTVMGAYLGHRLGMKVVHIEAGLRSFNWFNPFPEEIDRMLVSRIADIHFAPNDIAAYNLRKKKNVINTGQNTLSDSLKYAMEIQCVDDRINKLSGVDYFVFVLHRQENLSNSELVMRMIKAAIKASKKIKCVIILHKITEIRLKELGILDDIKNNPCFVAFSRVDYFDFMKLLSGAQFVITDGGSNQEELSYMGVPTFIVRKNTERNEGIGYNALLMGNDYDKVELFIQNYRKYRKKGVIMNDNKSPSEVIVNSLTGL